MPCRSCGGGRGGGGGATLRSTLASPEWGLVAQQGNRAMMHPTGALSEADYLVSGVRDAQHVARLAPPGQHPTIVDFGCGDGRVLLGLVELYRTVIGVDASRAMLRLAERALAGQERPGVLLVRDDGARLARKIPEQHRPVDAIVSIGVLQHMPADHGAQVLAQMGETVRPGGTVLLQIPIYEQATSVRAWSDIGTWTLPMLHDAATAAGLRVESPMPQPGRRGPAGGPYDRALQILRRAS